MEAKQVTLFSYLKQNEDQGYWEGNLINMPPQFYTRKKRKQHVAHIFLGLGFSSRHSWSSANSKLHWRVAGRCANQCRQLIITLWFQTQQILAWWLLRWLLLYFRPDLHKSSAVDIKIMCMFGKHIASAPMALVPNHLASCGVFNSHIRCAQCVIIKANS
jgi:hypothetical protein